MSLQVDKSFVVTVAPERAWRAFADSKERSQWEASPFEIDPRPGGRVHWALPGMACDGRVEEVVEGRRLRHSELSGPHAGTQVCVELEPADDGTRVRITHSGFGEGEAAERAVESTSLGWEQAIFDLVVWLERGVAAGRFVRAWRDPGMQTRDTPAGVEVVGVAEGGFAERAGLRPGDLLLALDGAPLFTLPELWALLRSRDPGRVLAVEYLRGREPGAGRAPF